MSDAAAFRSGKGERDENFPVASRLIAPRHRAPILAFYRFVRTADDVADHPTLTSAEKIRLLDRMAEALGGAGEDAEAQRLGAVLRERGLSPRHALDLLAAFRLDAEKSRYRDWDDLVGYCRLSAMPVGRYVLDVHGEDRATWAASDALCAALQIINHLQDCGEDYRNLDRVYVPLDALAAAGASVEDLGRGRASPPLLACLHGLARRSRGLLVESAVFPGQIRDLRLSLEVGVIHRLATSLVGKLETRDPLSERTHASKPEALLLAAGAILRGLLVRRSTRRAPGAGTAPTLPR